MNRVLRIFVPLGVVFAVLSGGVAAAEGTAGDTGEQAVVEVGKVKYTSAQLAGEFSFLPPPQLSALHRDDNAARIFAVKWYANVLFSMDATRNGLYGRRPGLQAAAQALTRQFVGLEYQDDLKDREYTTTDEELQQIYALDKEKICKVPARYRLARAGVVVGKKAGDAERSAGLARMDKITERLSAGEEFGDVAQDLSDLTGKLPNGELGWMTDAELGSAAGSAAITKLQPGEQTGVIETPQGKAVYAMLERTEAVTVPFETCRPALERALAKRFARDIKHRRVDELAEELNASMNIDEFIAAIRTVPVPVGWEQTWGRDAAR